MNAATNVEGAKIVGPIEQLREELADAMRESPRDSGE